MDKEELVAKLQPMAKKLRRESLFVMREMGTGWLGGSFSSADFITALFFYRMKHDPQNPCWIERDRLVISKGHSCEVFYAALAEAGYIDSTQTRTLQTVHIVEPVLRYLEQHDERYVLRCLQVGP